MIRPCLKMVLSESLGRDVRCAQGIRLADFFDVLRAERGTRLSLAIHGRNFTLELICPLLGSRVTENVTS